jgi:hypothetical protein
MPYLQKKADFKYCKNYRGITVLNISYKIISSLLHKRLSNLEEDKMSDCQMNFRPNMSTIDNILIIQEIYEKCEVNRPLI